VVIEETTTAPAWRGLMVNDPTLAAYFKAKGHRLLVKDQNVVDQNGQPPKDVKRFLDATKGKALPYVFLVDVKGNVVAQGDLPPTSAELILWLQKWGG
jgi:hypothetical protein